MAGTRATLYALQGSEYVAKVACALASKGVPFDYVLVEFSRKDRAKYFPKRTLQSSQAYVHLPVAKFPSGDVVVESADICKYLDEHFSSNGVSLLYPADKLEQIRELEKRMAATLYFGGMMLSVEDHKNFKRSIGKAALDSFPRFSRVPLIRELLLTVAQKVVRQQQRYKLTSEAPQFTEWLNLSYEDLKGVIMNEYAEIEAILSESTTAYFFDCKGPTAADFMLHALMHRLGGDNFGAFGAVLGDYKEVFSKFPALIRHFAELNSDSWVANNVFSETPEKVTYRYSDTPSRQSDRKPLGVPVNPERCPE